MAWQNEFVNGLPDPDMVGESEYRAVHDLILDVVQSTYFDDGDIAASVRYSLEHLRDEVLPRFFEAADKADRKST